MINKLGNTLPAWQYIVWLDGMIVPDDPVKARWGGDIPPPQIGERVRISINGIGPGRVLEYFEQEGYLGVTVQPDNAPAWYLKQNGGNVPCNVFGTEIKHLHDWETDTTGLIDTCACGASRA